MKRTITLLFCIAPAVMMFGQCTGNVTATAIVVSGENTETISGNNQTYWVCSDASGMNFSGSGNTILIESGASIMIGGSQNAVYYKGTTALTVFGNMNNLFGVNAAAFFDNGTANFIVECGEGNVVFNYDNAPSAGCNAVGINELDQAQFRLHPNPVTDVLYIDHVSAQVREARIFDLEGRQLHVYSGNSIRVIPISTLSTGTYLVHVNTAEGTAIRRFIKL